MSTYSVQTPHLAQTSGTPGFSGLEKAPAADLKLGLRYDKHGGIETHRETSLRISIHKDTGAVVIRVVDESTGEVIRELPPEQVLNGLQYIIRGPSGLVVNTTV